MKNIILQTMSENTEKSLSSNSTELDDDETSSFIKQRDHHTM